MAILGENIESPRELYVHKFGAALKMEMEKAILEDMLPAAASACTWRTVGDAMPRLKRGGRYMSVS
jgi:hypothetical protein